MMSAILTSSSKQFFCLLVYAVKTPPIRCCFIDILHMGLQSFEVVLVCFSPYFSGSMASLL